MAENSIQKAGSVVIDELKLIDNNSVIWDLTEFLIELNIYEDMFSSCMYGTAVLSDSRNLIEEANLVGEEYLNVKITTPTFDSSIQKTFRVFKINNRTIVRDNNTQIFTLNFASIELFNDILLPLFIPFEGTITDVAGEIFSNYIATTRKYEVSEGNDNIQPVNADTPLIITNEASNSVKFVSPGWTPFKCLNWLASKAIPREGIAKNYLFFESNKAFYFGSLEYIFSDAHRNNNYIGTYSVSPSNIRNGDITPDISREYFIARDVDMIDTFDHIKNYTSGYLANRLIALDVYNKKYDVIDYDHTVEYKNQFHTSGPGTSATPPFTAGGLRNSATNISYYPVNPKLYDNFAGNINEKMGEIYGNRRSSMLELSNTKMNITVPGRTDIEVGRILYFSYPGISPRNSGDNESEFQDKLYSGYYIITALHHKISKIDHSMRMEIVKDSLTLSGS